MAGQPFRTECPDTVLRAHTSLIVGARPLLSMLEGMLPCSCGSFEPLRMRLRDAPYMMGV